MRLGIRPTRLILAPAVALLATLLALPLVLAARADAFVYWTMNYPDQTKKSFAIAIGRANPDGTAIARYFIDAGRAADSSSEAEVAVGARHVYWIRHGVIGRAKLDGTHVERKFILTGADNPSSPEGLAVDAEHVYWTDDRGCTPPTAEVQCGAIGRANLDGTGIEQSFIPTQGVPEGIAVDAGHVYWTSFLAIGARTIARANLDGTGVDESFIATPATPDGPIRVAVNASHLYWTTGIPSEHIWAIGRANLDGTEVIPRFVFSAWAPGGIAVDANNIYLAEGTDGIGRLSLDDPSMGGLIAEFSDVHGIVQGVAVDGLTDSRLAGQASAPRAQKQSGKRIVVKVKVKAEERLTAEASGKVKVNPTYRLKPKKVKLDAGKTKTLRLKPKRAKAKRIAEALKRGEKAKAKLTVKLTDLARNRETEKLRVRLKR